MPDEYVVTIHEAIKMYDCLDTMQIGTTKISVLSEYRRDNDLGKYKFSVMGMGGKYIYAHYDELCIITLDDYTVKIGELAAKQLRIVAFIAVQENAKLYARLLAKERSQWEDEQKHPSEDTQDIPDTFADDDQ